MTKLFFDQTEQYKYYQKDKQRNKNVRKKQWSTSLRYCSNCYYSLNDNELNTHIDCNTAIRKNGRKVHPQLFKILKDKKNGKIKS